MFDWRSLSTKIPWKPLRTDGFLSQNLDILIKRPSVKHLLIWTIMTTQDVAQWALHDKRCAAQLWNIWFNKGGPYFPTNTLSCVHVDFGGFNRRWWTYRIRWCIHHRVCYIHLPGRTCTGSLTINNFPHIGANSSAGLWQGP